MSNKLVGLGQHSSLELTILWSRHRHASFRNFKNVILLSQQDSEKKCSLVVEIWNLSTNLAYNKTSWFIWGLFMPKQCYIPLTLDKLEKYFWLEQPWTGGSRSRPHENEKWIILDLVLKLNLSQTIETKKLPKENIKAALWRTFHNKFFIRDTIANLSHAK